MSDSPTFYDEIGGFDTFRRIVAKFYEGVAQDAVLRPMYPEADLGPAEERFLHFLVQYWGGPTTYAEQRGHPRLRMRHMPFRIGIAERDRWLQLMGEAMDETQVPPFARLFLDQLFAQVADFMRNQHEA